MSPPAKPGDYLTESKNQKPLPVPLNADAVLVLRRQVGKHPTWVFTFQGKPVGKANNHAWRKALVGGDQGLPLE